MRLHPVVRSRDSREASAFHSLCFSWQLHSLDTNQSPQLLANHQHHHSHFSPAPVPREFPEKQACQQRQNQAGWELDWLSLSGPLTAHQLTEKGVISVYSPSEFLCLYGFFFPSWNIVLFYFFFRELFVTWKGKVESVQVSSSEWNKLYASVLLGDTKGKVF